MLHSPKESIETGVPPFHQSPNSLSQPLSGDSLAQARLFDITEASYPSSITFSTATQHCWDAIDEGSHQLGQKAGSTSSGGANDDSTNSEVHGNEVPKSGCTCLSCRLVWTLAHGVSREPLQCRFQGCSYIPSYWEGFFHEKSHFRSPHEGRFQCLEYHCKFTTKRFPDLIRHYATKHCMNPKKFPCPVPFCKYSGDNGFLRQDKLKSHQRNVHKTAVTSRSSKTFQAIQPAVRGASVSDPTRGSSSSSSGGLNAQRQIGS